MKVWVIMYNDGYYPDSVQTDYFYDSKDKAQIALDNMWKESDNPDFYSIQEWEVK